MQVVSQQWQVLCRELVSWHKMMNSTRHSMFSYTTKALIRNIFIELDRRYVMRETSFASIV